MTGRTSIGFLLFPDMLQLDFTGPYGVLAGMDGAVMHLVAKYRTPVVSSDGLPFTPTCTFAKHPPFDVVIVPGGAGIAAAALADNATLDFLRVVSESCRFTASVCTGALILGAAGLLRGKRATTHWLSLDLLPLLGAVPVRERVVVDGNIATCAGVTSGIDLALILAGKIWGDDAAREVELAMEYAPQPPYAVGDPWSAPSELVQAAVTAGRERQEARRYAVLAAAAALGLRE